MLKIVSLFIITTTLLFATLSYHAKLEPYNSVTISASAAGEVVIANRFLEGKVVENETIIQIDDELDRAALKQVNEKIKLTEKMIVVSKKRAMLQQQIVKNAKQTYEKLRALPVVSQSKKDEAFNAYAAAKNSRLTILERIETLKSQLQDLFFKKRELQKRLSQKRIVATGYLYKLMVDQGNVVGIGTPLARVDDLSRGKLVLYLSLEEVDQIKNKKIFLDGKPSNAKIKKVWKVADDVHLSSYRVEVVVNNPNIPFSKLVKLEFR